MAAQQPTYQAQGGSEDPADPNVTYTVVNREGQDDFWLNIGAAFPHQDGDGYNILLQALPINGKIVLRPPKAQSEDPPAKPAERRTERRRDK